MTQWVGPGYDGDPIDPNPSNPAPPPVFYGPPSPGLRYQGYRVPAPSYPWSGYGQPPGAQRPSAATTTSVLAFVLGGVLLLDGFLLLIGASLVQSIQQSLDQSSGLPPSLVVTGLLNLAIGAILITGGLLFAHRRPAGRLLLAVGNVVIVGESIYWTVVSDVGAAALTVLHAAVAVIGLVLAFSPSATGWLRAGPPEFRSG